MNNIVVCYLLKHILERKNEMSKAATVDFSSFNKKTQMSNDFSSFAMEPVL